MIDFKKLTRNSCAGLAKASGDLADPGTKTDLETNPATCLDDVNEEAQGISEAKKQGKREIGTNSDQSFPVGFEREKDSENEGKPENDVSSMGYEPHFPFSPIFLQNLEIYRGDI